MKTYKKQGFSLVELMVAMLAAAILLMVLTVIFTMPYRTMHTNNEYARLRRDMAYAMRIMSIDTRESSSVGITVGNSHLFLPSNDIRAETIQYGVVEDALIRTVGGDDGETVVSGVRLFESAVATDGSATVPSGVILRLELENDDEDIVIKHETFIHMRN